MYTILINFAKYLVIVTVNNKQSMYKLGRLWIQYPSENRAMRRMTKINCQTINDIVL